jgi:four helix bundle protein
MEKLKQPFHDMIVWKESHRFTLLVYQRTECFPPHEKFGITSQLRRAAVSVEANLVEGRAKRSVADFLRFLNISDGSLQECAVLIEISFDLGYITEQQYLDLETQRRKSGYLLNALINGIKRKNGIVRQP